MDDKIFKWSLVSVAIVFTLLFCIVVIPPLIITPDIVGAFAAGFVNPYASGFSYDVIFCWLALAILVVYDAKELSVKFGWVCLLLGLFPGVAVGLSLYLLLRTKQITQVPQNE